MDGDRQHDEAVDLLAELADVLDDAGRRLARLAALAGGTGPADGPHARRTGEHRDWSVRS